MKETLGYFHIIILTYMIQSGVVLFRLPSILAANFGSNGWVAIPVASVIVILNLFLIGLVYTRGKGKSIFDIIEGVVPKAMAYPLYVILAIVWFMLACLVGKQYVLIFQMIAFPTTHPMIFKLIIDILVFLLVIKGIYNISKATTVIFYLTIWMLLSSFYFMREIELARYTSFIFYNSKDLLQGSIDLYTAFLGYELTILLFPFVSKSSKFIKGIMVGNVVTTIVYLIVCVIAFGFFSYQQLAEMLFPLLDLLAYIKLPFIERIENLLFTFFYLKVLITMVFYTWAAQHSISRIFKKTKANVIALIIIGVGYGIAFLFVTLEEVDNWLSFFANVETVIAFGLPLLCLLLLGIKKVRGQSEQAKS